MSMDTNWGNCVDKICGPDIPSQYLHTISYQSPGQSQEICQLSEIIQNLVQFRDNPRLLFSRPLPAFHHLRRLSNQSAVRQNYKSSHLTFLNRNWLYLAGKYYSAPVLCQKNILSRKSSFPIISKSLWRLCSLLSVGCEADCVILKVDISVCLTRLAEARQGWTYFNIWTATRPPASCVPEKWIVGWNLTTKFIL